MNWSYNINSGISISKAISNHDENWIGNPVVCLRGGKRGTCLRPPLFRALLEVCNTYIFLIFGVKHIIDS